MPLFEPSNKVAVVTEIERSIRTLEAKCKTAQQDFERLERTDTRDVVNDFENPRENAARYRGLDNYKAEIESERAKELKTENSSEGRGENTRSGDKRVI